jgi:chromosome segregation ATPase
VADNDSKTKKTAHSEVTRKEPGGFGKDPSGTFAGQEPFFVDLEAPETSFTEIPPEASNVERELDRLQSQVATFQKAPDAATVSSEQADILKKYITLKESESRDLKEIQKQYQVHVKKLTSEVHSLSQKTHDLVTEVESLRRREEAAKAELRALEKQSKEDLARAKHEFGEQQRLSVNASAEIQDLQRKREEWKDKVREDLKRIKLKERELENKYELLKRDTQALLDSKDKHVMELKRKNDALELEMELLEERLRNATLAVSSISAKKRRLIETLRLATALLEEVDANESFDSDEKKAG